MPREAGRRQVRTREGAVGRPDVTGTRRLPAPTGFPPTPPPAVPRYPCACIPLSSVASRARVYPGQHGRRSARRASTGGRRQLDVLALSGSGSYSLTRTRSPHDPRVGRRYGSHSDRSQTPLSPASPQEHSLAGRSSQPRAAGPGLGDPTPSISTMKEDLETLLALERANIIANYTQQVHRRPRRGSSAGRSGSGPKGILSSKSSYVPGGDQSQSPAEETQARPAGSPWDPWEDAELSLCRLTDHHGFLQ
ncbi:uncharacterized protein LOC118016226 isoform X2 [Mirounga leonina]|uniref:uncharacterized protein LOC118016226 isoform X2 n=1 Tax=Mirounga leonina TaxID=9715 RepID=UPI00156C2F8C|nr:uncharacterized protein LOC118016226 isoform X2 [Mirounga leonina]